MNRFYDKVAVVMGGARGIGLAITDRLLSEGAKVAVCDVNEEALAALSSRSHPNCVGILCDVTNEQAVQSFIAHVAESFGSIRCAFNVAGAARGSYLVDTTESDFDFTVDLCLKGAFFCMKHQARHMMEQGQGGSIVNVSSHSAFIPQYVRSVYCASKAGLQMLTSNAALELGPFGIRVNSVMPGVVDTALTTGMFSNPVAVENFNSRTPLGRSAKPDDISGPAVFLATDDARHITGIGLVVDGGMAVSGYPDTRPFRPAHEFNPDAAYETLVKEGMVR